MTYIDDSESGAIEYSYSNTGCSAGCGNGFVDKITKEITPLGTIEYEYNALGWRTKATIAGQEPIYYNYDKVGRLASLVQGDKTVTFTYDAIGRRTSMTLPNGIVASYTYDAASRLSNITYSSDSQILKSLDYTYDNNGDRLSFSGHKTLFPESKTASYNQANQQIQINSDALSYDANGNLISKGDTTYTWNARNKLAAISSPSFNASFKYDPSGRRVEKTIDGKTISYLYDRWNIMQEIENGTVTTNYLRSLKIDETLGIMRDDSTYYYLRDALGSTIALTDPYKNIATEYYYDPFGKTETSNSNIYNPFQYTGRENDGNGIYHYRWRYKIGERFASEDPIRFASGDVNFFSYVGNNPVNWIDPLGLRCVYSQSTGQMTCIDDQTGEDYYNETGYSGTGQGRNNPDMQNVTNTGPIPRGQWEVGAPYDSPNTGRNTIPLRPSEGNECFDTPRDCDTFRVHGNNARNDASHGCIVLPRNRTQIPYGETIDVVR